MENKALWDSVTAALLEDLDRAVTARRPSRGAVRRVRGRGRGGSAVADGSARPIIRTRGGVAARAARTVPVADEPARLTKDERKQARVVVVEVEELGARPTGVQVLKTLQCLGVPDLPGDARCLHVRYVVRGGHPSRLRQYEYLPHPKGSPLDAEHARRLPILQPHAALLLAGGGERPWTEGIEHVREVTSWTVES